MLVYFLPTDERLSVCIDFPEKILLLKLMISNLFTQSSSSSCANFVFISKIKIYLSSHKNSLFLTKIHIQEDSSMLHISQTNFFKSTKSSVMFDKHRNI